MAALEWRVVLYGFFLAPGFWQVSSKAEPLTLAYRPVALWKCWCGHPHSSPSPSRLLQGCRDSKPRVYFPQTPSTAESQSSTIGHCVPSYMFNLFWELALSSSLPSVRPLESAQQMVPALGSHIHGMDKMISSSRACCMQITFGR